MEQQLNLACNQIKEQYQLTLAERSVLVLLAEGLSPTEIADKRARSLATVRTQIKNIMAKMNVTRAHNILVEVFRIAHAQPEPFGKSADYKRDPFSEGLSIEAAHLIHGM